MTKVFKGHKQLRGFVITSQCGPAGQAERVDGGRGRVLETRFQEKRMLKQKDDSWRSCNETLTQQMPLAGSKEGLIGKDRAAAHNCSTARKKEKFWGDLHHHGLTTPVTPGEPGRGRCSCVALSQVLPGNWPRSIPGKVSVKSFGAPGWMTQILGAFGGFA